MTPGSVWAMKRALATIATVIAGTAGLTACTDEQAYCVDLAKYAAKAVDVDPQKPVDYVKILDDAKKLQESAPDGVKDDWGVVVTFAEKAQKAGSDRVELAEPAVANAIHRIVIVSEAGAVASAPFTS